MLGTYTVEARIRYTEGTQLKVIEHFGSFELRNERDIIITKIITPESFEEFETVYPFSNSVIPIYVTFKNIGRNPIANFTVKFDFIRMSNNALVYQHTENVALAVPIQVNYERSESFNFFNPTLIPGLLPGLYILKISVAPNDMPPLLVTGNYDTTDFYLENAYDGQTQQVTYPSGPALYSDQLYYPRAVVRNNSSFADANSVSI